MNTLFQSSMKRSFPALTPSFRSAPSRESVSGPPRSMWISVQGPQGPVSPISQKLSLRPKKSTCAGSTSVDSFQMRAESSSRGRPSFSSPPNTVTHSRSRGRPHTFVRSSHAHGIASALK